MSGELPKGWEPVSLGELGALHCGQSPTASTVNRTGVGTPYVSGPEQWDGTTVHLDKWTTSPTREVSGDTIFITVKGAGVGTTFPGVSACIGRDIYAFEPFDGISKRYIHLAIDHTISEIIRAARGDIPGLAKPDILDHRIGLAPATEQRRIVEKIDALFARSTRARDELARITRLIERYRQAVLEAAFRGDLTAEWALSADRQTPPPVEENLAGVWACESMPAHWDWRPFNKVWHDLTSSDKKIPQKEYEPNADGLIPVIDQGQELVGGYTSKTYVAYDGLLPVIVFGDHTRCVKYCDFQFSQGADGVKVLRPLDDVDARFSYWMLKAITLPDAGYSRHMKFLRSSFFPVPPVAEQHEMVRQIELHMQAITAIAQQADKAHDLLARLDASILDKAFSGQLVPQDPADEPASVLLERVKAARAAAPAARRGRKAKG